ncbi:hypothetical protein K438DRAFT_1788179 [Mycena galopus ATCC 62051]|nr:hypothetical protein K438DRAFT_1788179 [Mycena galopus ATCC 62051]
MALSLSGDIATAMAITRGRRLVAKSNHFLSDLNFIFRCENAGHLDKHPRQVFGIILEFSLKQRTYLAHPATAVVFNLAHTIGRCQDTGQVRVIGESIHLQPRQKSYGNLLAASEYRPNQTGSDLIQLERPISSLTRRSVVSIASRESRSLQRRQLGRAGEGGDGRHNNHAQRNVGSKRTVEGIVAFESVGRSVVIRLPAERTVREMSLVSERITPQRPGVMSRTLHGHRDIPVALVPNGAVSLQDS